MTDDLLARVLREIEDRRAELAAAVQEYNRLESARAALEGVPGSGTQPSRVGPTQRRRTATPSRRTSRSRRQRAPRGANREAVRKALEKQPGASVPELASLTGIDARVLYQLRRRLVDEGILEEAVRSDGRKGYALVRK